MWNLCLPAPAVSVIWSWLRAGLPGLFWPSGGLLQSIVDTVRVTQREIRALLPSVILCWNPLTWTTANILPGPSSRHLLILLRVSSRSWESAGTARSNLSAERKLLISISISRWLFSMDSFKAVLNHNWWFVRYYIAVTPQICRSSPNTS